MLNVSLVLKTEGCNILDPQSFLTRSPGLCVMEKRGLCMYVPPDGLLPLSSYFFFFLLSFYFICSLGNCLHDVAHKVTIDLLLCLFANTNVGWPLRAPWPSSFCSMFLLLFSRSLFLLIKATFCQSMFELILHNLETHRSCQSQLFWHHQSGFWIQIRRWYLLGFSIFWLAFPECLSLVLLPS